MRSLLAPLLTAAALATQGFAAPLDVAKEAAKIDALLAADWKEQGLEANPDSDDATFLRRIYLDVVGRIPTAREVEAFNADASPDRRAKLIDKLIGTEGQALHDFNYWADVLRAQTNGQARRIAGTAYIDFLKDSLRENKPYDELVREMISAQGKAWENGAIGYYMRDRGMPLDNMANTSRVFLGTRIECAQCHDHPFDEWTQMQFYEMAAFTYGIDTNNYYGDSMTDMRQMVRDVEKDARDKSRSKDPKVRKQGEKEMAAIREKHKYVNRTFADLRNRIQYTQVGFNEGRDLRLPHDYQYSDAEPKSVVEAATMMGHDVQAKPGETPLESYARWMTSPENPRFTKVIANRMWKRAFGRALIEPLDELMSHSVPINPPLMEQLEKLMVQVDYDLQAFQTVLLNTRAYQAEVTRAEVSPGEAYHFTGPLLRRMTPEQMWDSFVTLINPDPDMANPEGARRSEELLMGSAKYRDALDSMTAEELYEGALAASESYRTRNSKIVDLQTRIAEARAAEETDKVRKLSATLRDIQNETRRSLDRNIVMPAMMKLADSKGIEPVVMRPSEDSKRKEPSSMSMQEMMSTDGLSSNDILITGYDKPEPTAEEKRAASQAQQVAWAEEASYYGMEEKEMKYYYKARSTQMKSWLRAAEIESPAPRGHYLREFGQSDRVTIENANHEASVPQALAMMNGQLLPQIMGRYSQLMLTVSKAEYPDDKLDAVYQSVLARAPKPAEKEAWLKAQEQGLDKIEDLVFALLNTQQFIFVQ